jgi:hypothetical protein
MDHGTGAAQPIDELVSRLLAPSSRHSAAEFPSKDQHVDTAGLYSWWVDAGGAEDLSRGLGDLIPEGLIYAGQTGAVVGVGHSQATLRGRIGRNHLGGNVSGSTFRWSIAAALEKVILLIAVGPRELTSSSEGALTAWMRDHLSVAVAPVPDRSTLDAVETVVSPGLIRHSTSRRWGRHHFGSSSASSAPLLGRERPTIHGLQG